MSSSSARAAARARGGRTRKPLYPRAWGSGKNPFKGVYKAYSMVASGRDDLECGDKIILPEEAFREVSRLRLEFPLTMMLANARKGGPRGPSEGKAPVQVCGVLEFSAPKGVCHIPQWIMTSLSIREGGRINVKSAPKLPKGEFVRFRPRDQAFMDFSQALGVRNILEITMQHYSALSVGQTVFIQYGSDKFFLDVVELRPAKAISLYGSVDLEVEFAEVGEGDLPSPITKNAVLEENLQPSNGNQKATTTTMASKGAGRARSSPSSTPRSSRPRPRQAKKVESKTSSRTAAGSSSSRARDKRNPSSRQQSGPAKPSNSSSSSSSNAAAAPTSGAGLSKRQQRLAQFRKSSMTSAVSAAPTASIAGNSLTTATTGAASQSQGNVAGPATAVTEEPSRKKEKDGEDGEEEQRHRWGTGVTLDGKVVSSPVATPKQAPAASAPSAASAGTGNDDGDKEDTGIAFTGSGNTLGGGGGGGGGGDASSETKKASAVPWADIARQRHQRHAKKMAEERRKQEEAARKLAEEALAKQQAEAAAALAAMTEEELARKQEEERLARKRAELESQIEEKLIRDAELKEKKEQRRQKKKQELADREAAMNRQMEELEAAAVAEAVQKSVEAQTAHAPSTPAEVEEAMVAAAIVDSVSSRTPAPAAVAAPTPEPAPSIASQNASSFKYADQLASLVDMGFTDVHSNEAALEACGGDVHRAVGMLTGSTESSSRRRRKPANGRVPAVGSAVNAARNQQRRGVGSSGSSMPRKNDRYNKGGRKRTPPMGSRSKRF